MDSTLINIECVDEIADAVGRKEEVAARSRSGHAQRDHRFQRQPARRRVALLRGVTVADMERVDVERLSTRRGRVDHGLQAVGMKVLLVSSGFHVSANGCANGWASISRAPTFWKLSGPNCGQLTGRLVDQAWGDICDGAEAPHALRK